MRWGLLNRSTLGVASAAGTPIFFFVFFFVDGRIFHARTELFYFMFADTGYIGTVVLVCVLVFLQGAFVYRNVILRSTFSKIYFYL